MRPDYCPIGNEPCQSLCDTPCSTQQRYTTDAMKVRQAVAQAVLQHEAKDEPVAWRTFDGEGGYDYRTYDMNENYANEWNERNPKHNGWVEPLYTAPPQREWVGLTDEDIRKLAKENIFVLNAIIATNAKLKEKNFD